MQSFDFTHSSKVVFNILAQSYSEFGINNITYDFINDDIIPDLVDNEDARIIFNDYKDWLPELAKSHNADSKEIEKLRIKMEVDFSKYKHPEGMIDTIQLEMKTHVDYKIKDRSAEQISFNEIDIYGKIIMPQKLKDEFWGNK